MPRRRVVRVRRKSEPGLGLRSDPSGAFDDEDGVRAGCECREAMRLVTGMGEIVADAEFERLPEHLDARCPVAEQDDVLDRSLRVRFGTPSARRFGLDEVDVASGVRRRWWTAAWPHSSPSSTAGWAFRRRAAGPLRAGAGRAGGPRGCRVRQPAPTWSPSSDCRYRFRAGHRRLADPRPPCDLRKRQPGTNAFALERGRDLFTRRQSGCGICRPTGRQIGRRILHIGLPVAGRSACAPADASGRSAGASADGRIDTSAERSSGVESWRRELIRSL